MASAHAKTAVLLTDPYNDFLHPEGKAHAMIAEASAQMNTPKHIQDLIAAARKHKIPIYYGLHQQCRPGYIAGWNHASDSILRINNQKVFEEGSWGVEFYEGCEPDINNGDVVVSKHWNSSSFENTDLDFQLRQRDITHLVCGGLTANTCLEATARQAYERGYRLTMISDATAGFSIETHKAATDLIWPLFANRVMKTDEWIASLGDN